MSLRRAPLVCGVSLVLALSGCDRKPEPQPATPSPSPTATPTPQPTIPPAPTPTPQPTPVPTPYVPQKILNTGSIFSGIHFKTRLETVAGSTATKDRGTADSYTVEVSVKVAVPKPHRSMEELSRINDGIGRAMPELEALLESAKVSPEFDELYRRKVTSVRSNLDRLDQLLSRHNFYDCETILELTHPETQRRALLIQADMDVDTDGADGDRMPTFDTSSRTYQPMTSYRWKKRTPTPNPCAPMWEKRIAETEAKIKDPKNAGDAPKLKADLARLRAELLDMKNHSYLIGSMDPFIVLPVPMFTGKKNGFTPRLGDYCAVLAGDVFYPAIIGDMGPSAKMGEASLRLCREVNPRANGDMRAVSDLKVTYIVFPGTAEKETGPPDLLLLQRRCAELLDELGEHGGKFFLWQEPPPEAPPDTPPASPAQPGEAKAPPIGAEPAKKP